ncbi:MAG: methyltransferase domain-containing protein [Chloroflexota bacterium]|nr:methyltransferase domain-containing protein [Chloroflexota bacterium]
MTDPSPADWDAATYDRISDPQARWGREVLGRLPLRGEEAVLDAGCGSGRVTEQLAERLRDGRVIALDASASMLAEARRRLARFGNRVEYLQADLREPLPLARPIDAVFSTATFHWIVDHDALFANLAAVLAPAAWLVAQCGGRGNIGAVGAALHELGLGLGEVYFAGAEETRQRLERAGFTGIETWLSEEPVAFHDDEELQTFLATVVLRQHIAFMGDGEREALVRAVARRLPNRTIDYVRLNITARRAIA